MCSAEKQDGRVFAVFILSYGRAGRVYTLDMLERLGYSGRLYIVADDTDKSLGEYERIYGDKLIVFNKESVRHKFDMCDNFGQTNTVTFARNAIYDIAREKGVTHFLVLDDDYSGMHYRADTGLELVARRVRDVNKLFSLMVDFLDETGIKSVAFAQGGDYIGGRQSGSWKRGYVRKAMNSFFFRTDNPVEVIGRLNDDVNTYTYWGSRGDVFLTIMKVGITQVPTQQSKGGLTEAYLDSGTYVKSFYSVMVMPSAVVVGELKMKHARFHHKISWINCVPRILPESAKKP